MNMAPKMKIFEPVFSEDCIALYARLFRIYREDFEFLWQRKKFHMGTVLACFSLNQRFAIYGFT